MSEEGEGFDEAASEMGMLRKDQGGGAVPMGYAGVAQNPLEVKGDKDAPYFKIPPFPHKASRYVQQAVLPAFGLLGPRLDTKSHRIITLWVEYVPQTDNSRLSIFPLAFNEHLDIDMPVGTVDATLTVGANPAVGQRNIYETELRTNLISIAAGFRISLDFQCAAYQSMRFSFLETAFPDSAGALNVDISSNE